MPTITTYPFTRHLRATSTSHIEHLANGRVRHQGAGTAFWFRPLSAAISEVPVDDREHEVLVRLRTADLQGVTVPCTITYRFADPGLAARRVDFSIDLRKGFWLGRPLEVVGAMIHGAAAAAITAALSDRELVAILRLDPAELSATVARWLETDGRLAAIGIEVVGIRFAPSRPDPDVERALQTPTRETIQQDADKATFERRALAVEREAAIGENELANQIELARRQQDLIAQRGVNARREAEDAAAADAIAAQAQASRTLAVAQAQAAADEAIGHAAAETERAKLAAYENTTRDVLVALALKEVAANLPEVGQIVLTPDVVTGLIGRLVDQTRR